MANLSAITFIRTPPVIGTIREISGVTSSIESTWISTDRAPPLRLPRPLSFSGHQPTLYRDRLHPVEEEVRAPARRAHEPAGSGHPHSLPERVVLEEQAVSRHTSSRPPSTPRPAARSRFAATIARRQVSAETTSTNRDQQNNCRRPISRHQSRPRQTNTPPSAKGRAETQARYDARRPSAKDQDWARSLFPVFKALPADRTYQPFHHN